MAEELDIRQYAETLIRRWKWIVGIALIAVLGTFLIGLLRPERKAIAILLVARTRTDVVLDPSIETQLLEPARLQDLQARRETLVALASTNEMVERVLAEIGDQLEPQERNAISLRDMVTTSNDGDLIHITARHQDPSKAALIANAWARHFVQYVNDLYGNTEGLGSSVSDQATLAWESYIEAQTSLETFLADNQILGLEQAVSTRQEILDVYQSTRDSIRQQPFLLQRGVMNDNLQDLRMIDRWIADAQALREQLATGSGLGAANAGNALALITLQIKALGSWEEMPIELVVPQMNGDQGVQLADVDAFLAVLEARRTETQALIDSISDSFLAGESSIVVESENQLDEQINSLNAEIGDLQARLEAQRAESRQLRQDRDLAWETYQTLAQTQTETEITSQLTGTQVRLADLAVPETQLSRIDLGAMLQAGVAGLIAGVFVVLVVDWWQREKEEPEKGNEPLYDEMEA